MEAACIGKLLEIRKGNRRFIFTVDLVQDCRQAIASFLIRSDICWFLSISEAADAADHW